jgi:hypothetical protein
VVRVSIIAIASHVVHHGIRVHAHAQAPAGGNSLTKLITRPCQGLECRWLKGPAS